MKAREKVMITNITSAIEETISPAWEQPKKVIRAIEKSAKKLANKLVKASRKEAKHQKKTNQKKALRRIKQG